MDPLQFLLSACGSRGEEEEEEQLQRATLEEVEVLEIDHGSTTLFVETGEVEALEVSLLQSGSSAGSGAGLHEVKLKTSSGEHLDKITC
ncbi:hypothetical protein [Paenibacillus sp. NPDC093718]|uniref:hypothetical protein n=1 Tax=Paenibacillus sp. NPDC093718 TaxID=3390601 RepID=UPI003D049FD8